MSNHESGDMLRLPYAIDFDGCLAESVWPDRGIGAPMFDNFDKLEEVAEAGHNIIIHSARGWSDFGRLEAWLQHHKVPYDGIMLGKYLAIKYVDDKAVNSEMPSWL